jgi:DNA-binding CsgD family transcriptional regulator
VKQFDKLIGLLDTLGVSDPDLSPQPELVDALIRLRREDEARTAAHRYLSAANAKGQPWACARAERAVGLLAPDDEIDHHFGAALQTHERTLDRFEVGRTLLGYGSRLRRARRRVDARPQLREALAVFDELGASRWSDQAAAELEATGETVRRRGPADIAALTPQELQVSLLLAEGRTTREAAAALFLSPKTVDYHLRKVYTKLGIRSRAELADLLPH